MSTLFVIKKRMDYWPQQCGYHANRSTVDHLMHLETFICDAFIQNQHLVAVFFDLQIAYDTTWKHGIQQDLHDMGLRGNSPIFIGNFLADRTFQVHLGTILSDKIFHQEGVPQGVFLSTLYSMLKSIILWSKLTLLLNYRCYPKNITTYYQQVRQMDSQKCFYYFQE